MGFTQFPSQMADMYKNNIRVLIMFSVIKLNFACINPIYISPKYITPTKWKSNKFRSNFHLYILTNNKWNLTYNLNALN